MWHTVWQDFSLYRTRQALGSRTWKQLRNAKLGGRSYLLFYQALAKRARSEWPQRKMYKLIPKNHSMLHCCLYAKLTKRNTRHEHLYGEEGFMKVVATICGKCHPSTMDSVALFRYRALKELR